MPSPGVVERGKFSCLFFDVSVQFDFISYLFVYLWLLNLEHGILGV